MSQDYEKGIRKGFARVYLDEGKTGKVTSAEMEQDIGGMAERIGMFKGTHLDGPAAYYYPSGEVRIGIWKYGRLLDGIESNLSTDNTRTTVKYWKEIENGKEVSKRVPL